jgi:hypothetical protein
MTGCGNAKVEQVIHIVVMSVNMLWDWLVTKFVRY